MTNKTRDRLIIVGCFLLVVLTIFLPKRAEAADFRIYPFMENEDGSEMLREDIAEFRVYCTRDGEDIPPVVVPAEPMTDTDNPQSPLLRSYSHFFGVGGYYECRATTVDTEGDESKLSSTKISFTEAIVTIPVPPRIFYDAPTE